MPSLNAKALEAAHEAYDDAPHREHREALYDAITAYLSSLPQAGVSEPLTSQERFLLEWLGKEESSALGECSGCDLDVLINRGFAVIAPAPEGQHRHFGRVSLTDAGRATLSCQQEEAVPVATMHRSDTEILFSKGYVPNMLGFTSSPLYASPVPADAGEPGIKALEWVDNTQGPGCPLRFLARVPFGRLQIYEWGDEWAMNWGGRYGKVVGKTLEAAKAAAQADYEARIRSALVPATSKAKGSE